MAPTTRSKTRSSNRVIQDPPTTRSGTRGNPVVLEDTTEPVEDPATPRASARTSKGNKAVRVKNSAVAKTKAKPKTKVPAAKRECLLCATNKTVSHSFRLSGKAEACKHFQDICSACISNLLRTKMEDRELDDPDLECPFPKCGKSLNTILLKQAGSNKAMFEKYDQALVKHHLSADPNYIACLSPKCGQYFSIEDCQGKPHGSGKRTTKLKAACPYCDHEICLTCNRPWHALTCDKAKQKEDADSVKMIKRMGAKPCPQCGANIQKNGGCDHMTCSTCRHHFCWQCFGRDEHVEGCPHRRRNVAIDHANWIHDNMNMAQINNLIAQAHGPQPRGTQPQQPPAVVPGGPPALP